MSHSCAGLIKARQVPDDKGLDNASATLPRRIVPALEAETEPVFVGKPAEVAEPHTQPSQKRKYKTGVVDVDGGLDNVSAISPRRKVPALETRTKPTKITRMEAGCGKNKTNGAAQFVAKGNRLSMSLEVQDRVSVFVQDETEDESGNTVRLSTGGWYSGSVKDRREVVKVTVGCRDGTYRYGVVPISKLEESEKVETARNKTLLSSEIGSSVCVSPDNNDSEVEGIVVSRVHLKDYYVEFNDGDGWWVNKKYDPIVAISEKKPEERRARRKVEPYHSKRSVLEVKANKGKTGRRMSDALGFPRLLTY